MQSPWFHPILQHVPTIIIMKVDGKCPKSILTLTWNVNEAKLKCLKLSNKSFYMVWQRYQPNSWRLKSSGMWCYVTGWLVPGVSSYNDSLIFILHSYQTFWPLKMSPWGSLIPSIANHPLTQHQNGDINCPVAKTLNIKSLYRLSCPDS